MKDKLYRGLAICHRGDALFGDSYMIMEDGGFDWIQRPPFKTVDEAKSYIDGLQMGKYLALNRVASIASEAEQEQLEHMNGTGNSDGVCRPIW